MSKFLFGFWISLLFLPVYGYSPLVQADVTFLEQGITEEERAFLNHANQGTRFMPYRWFINIENAEGENLLGAKSMRKYKYIIDDKSSTNPDGLPVGFTKDVDESGMEWAGFSCSSCHTGQIEYKGRNLRIDGGPAMQDPTTFMPVLFKQLLETYMNDKRFERFASRVLADGKNEQSSEELKKDVWGLITKMGKRVIEGMGDKIKLELISHFAWGKPVISPVKAGFGRLDALSTGGNVVLDPITRKNYVVANAPVSYPHIWEAFSFDWVEYNGSIRQPMGRNVAEALGVGAALDLQDDLWKSSVKIGTIHKIEQIYNKVVAPKWPEDILGKISRAKAAKGKRLFQENCSSCHAARYTSASDDTYGKTYLKIPLFALDEIGTDPLQATNLKEHRVEIPESAAARLKIKPGKHTVHEALEFVTTKVIERYYDDNGLSLAKRHEIDSYRENSFRAPLAYRARPLDGIWATPPFLHNGSVPNMMELLSPYEERSKVFYVGSREYDPEDMGFDSSEREDVYKFEIKKEGNWNTGHEFSDEAKRKGVIGRKLSVDERRLLIEYIKTL
ncbi:MAG: cytochrome c [Dehalococcoidia bacterium]|nr:cytochrome c [Dehalococcoidia bacterium]